VAFPARSAPGSPNADIYIFRSDDGGQTFPMDTPGYFLHLTDAMLGLAATADGPDQVLPAIEIDGCGGVNLLFYDNRHDPDLTDADDYVDAWYARIVGFASGSPSVAHARLTSQTFPTPIGNPDFLGHYQQLAAAGPARRRLYIPYIVNEYDSASGEWRVNCYAHRVQINRCLSDMNLSGASEPEDITLFESAYLAQDSTADLNEDGSVDGTDAALFYDAHAAGWPAE
jgi:hypothetical protein